MDITVIDLGFAIWSGVITALWLNARKETRYQRHMMVEMVKDLHDGTIEIVKTGDGYKFEIAKDKK